MEEITPEVKWSPDKIKFGEGVYVPQNIPFVIKEFALG